MGEHIAGLSSLEECNWPPLCVEETLPEETSRAGRRGRKRGGGQGGDGSRGDWGTDRRVWLWRQCCSKKTLLLGEIVQNAECGEVSSFCFLLQRLVMAIVGVLRQIHYFCHLGEIHQIPTSFSLVILKPGAIGQWGGVNMLTFVTSWRGGKYFRPVIFLSFSTWNWWYWKSIPWIGERFLTVYL